MFGADPTPGIVAIERFGERAVRLYRRDASNVTEDTDAFTPWLITSEQGAEAIATATSVIRLSGDEALCQRLTFQTWSAWLDASRALRDDGTPLIAFPSAAEQYLIDSGKGLFRGMSFEALRRAQIDIETLGLQPQEERSAIVLIAVAINGQSPTVIRGDEITERDMLLTLTDWIRTHDPDVIEGHNLFNFDLSFLVERARRHNITLTWGRDGSPVRIGNEQRFKAGARTIPYQGAWVYGRHLIDTYQQIQRYDSTGQLESYALKPAIEALGLTRGDRTFVAGQDVADAWIHRREELVRYVCDDVADVNTLSELALPTEFYQARLLPRSFQSVATGGPGEKINDLLIRAYAAQNESIPVPRTPRDYPGGYAELRSVGRFAPVVKCDVESLYPSIMLADAIAPASDRLGVFLPILHRLTDRRLAAKRAELLATGRDRAQWRGIQSSFKVLINSFYGYLGYGRGYFNDFAAAERVTLRGQELVQHVVRELERQDALAIEIDTDGVFFQPPESTTSFDGELELLDRVNATLPERIRLAHDGRYRGMLSLKLKNYALMDFDGRITLKGSSLRSRRDERFLRRFVRDAVVRLLEPGRYGDIRDYYLDTAQQIVSGALTVEDIARWETITDQTFSSESNRRLAGAAGAERVGERLLVYQREDGSVARASAYHDDEDRVYLLRRLRDMAERFRPLFDDASEFDYTFPLVTLRTDLAALRDAQPVVQLGLFGAN
jgi:DNA polymerase elongation subunit (family B)